MSTLPFQSTAHAAPHTRAVADGIRGPVRALSPAQQVANALAGAHLSLAAREAASGDRVRNRRPSDPKGKGLFAKKLHEALLDAFVRKALAGWIAVRP